MLNNHKMIDKHPEIESPENDLEEMSLSAKIDEKLQKAPEGEGLLIPDENRLTEEALIGGEANEELQPGEFPIGSIQESYHQNLNGRIDRFGVQIVARHNRLKNNLKSGHKVTYLDQVHNQAN
mgnify:CR=1 FL=1